MLYVRLDSVGSYSGYYREVVGPGLGLAEQFIAQTLESLDIDKIRGLSRCGFIPA